MAQRAPRSLEVLNDLDQKHAVGDGQVPGVLGSYRVKVDVVLEVLVEPVDRIDPVKLGRLPGVPDLAEQVSAPAPDVEPAKMWFGMRGRESALDDFVDGC